VTLERHGRVLVDNFYEISVVQDTDRGSQHVNLFQERLGLGLNFVRLALSLVVFDRLVKFRGLNGGTYSVNNQYQVSLVTRAALGYYRMRPPLRG
jgi:hypothetical protein